MPLEPRELTFVASDVAPVGGMERVAFELCSRLRARGWHLTVIARSCALPPGPGLDFHRIAAPGRPVSVALALSWVHGSWLLRRHARGLVHTNMPVVAGRVDVISVHFSESGWRAGPGASLDARSSRPSPLFRLNSIVASQLELRAERWSYRPARVRRLACVSEGVAGEVREHFPAIAPVTGVIHNGVDRGRFHPDAELGTRTRAQLGIAPGARVAAFVGGDWERKGLRHAIAGVGAAPGWELVVVGDGDRPRHEDAARAAGARVHFVGRHADPRPYYAAADALVLPTSYEAFSLVTLEAAACGLALLVAPVHGTAELVQEGVNGWRVPADGTAIAERLRLLAADEPRLRAMQGAAVAASAAFDWEAIADAYERLYDGLTAES